MSIGVIEWLCIFRQPIESIRTTAEIVLQIGIERLEKCGCYSLVIVKLVEYCNYQKLLNDAVKGVEIAIWIAYYAPKDTF